MSDWDLYLNYVCFALNSVKSRHTGYSANMAVFGRELNTPLSVLVENENPDLSSVKNKSYGQAIWEHHRLVKDIVSKVELMFLCKLSQNCHKINIFVTLFNCDTIRPLFDSK